MKSVLSTTSFILFTISVVSQNTIKQNGLQSTVLNQIRASGTQAKRFEIAQLSYNSHHWQNSSIVTVELYNVRFQSGYEKYVIELGYRQGAQSTSPKVTLVESRGISHSAKITLGIPSQNATSRSGYPNLTIPVYADVRHYASYVTKITHLKNRVSNFTNDAQIIINEAPVGLDIPDFTIPKASYNLTNGNVGIGTKNPTYKFEWANGNNTGFLDFTLEGNAIGSKTGNLGLWTGGSEKLTVQQNGNIGIGTKNPKDFKLGVNGRIAATEVKVALYDNWSDFVFYDNYKLPTLLEVENHIREKGHLKDIPSAKEVQKNGIFLGEMDSKLLQKIEELTLYTISQEKDLEKLKKENVFLKETLLKFSKRLELLEKTKATCKH